MLRHITGLLMLLASINVYSQNILTASIEWNSTSTFAAETGSMTGEITKVVSSPTQITWYDNEGGVKYAFDITGSEGAWTNVSNNGSIIFRVNSGNFSGVVQFTKASGVTTVRIHLALGESNPIYELTVNNVNTL